MKYLDSLIKSMEWLSDKDDTLFIGQSVKYSGNSIFNTLKKENNFYIVSNGVALRSYFIRNISSRRNA